jgi:lipooligosaccharide transport system permease protein
VTAEALWIAARAGTYGCAPMLVAIVFGLDLGWGMLLVPFIGFIAGFGWGNFGIGIAARMNSIDNFSYVISAVLTPLFLFAGTFFPIDGLPEWAQVLAQCNPLYHLVQLVRDAVFGNWSWDDLGHLAVLLAFGALTWRLAVRWMERKLVV